MRQPLVACCDLGGTKMMVGISTIQGEILASEKYLVESRMQPHAVIEDLSLSVRRLLAQINAERTDIVAFGCSTTGVMNVETGIITMNHNMGWVDVPFRALLENQFQVPVALEMDANAAALGEWWRGVGDGFHSFNFVIVGTGIGSGILLNDQILRGSHGTAGEIGHTVLIPSGPLCGCGKHGCLEALSSGLAIARKANAAVLLGQETTLSRINEPLTARHVVEAARRADAISLDILGDAIEYLGIGLANFITVFDPEAIILGGGIGWGAFDLLSPRLERAIQRHLNYWASRSTPILRSALGETAGLLGAVYIALKGISQDLYSEALL